MPQIHPHPWISYDRIIVFDGVCKWCSFWVNFVIARDPFNRFKFATLQSDNAQQILKAMQLSTEDFSTLLLIEHGQVFVKSTAVLKVMQQLKGPWPMLYLCIVIPRSLRDAIYDLIGRHRYIWMGKTQVCRMPTQDERERFV